jgi:spermidine synthase
MDLWYTEKHTEGRGITIKTTGTLYQEKTPYQDLSILKTDDFGNLMLLDGLVMLTEKDEFVYHEMITHISLYSHKNPKKVLIIGGGDGGTLREAVRHETVERAVLVEIDEAVIESSKKYFPEVAKGLYSEKAEVRVEDGIKYIKETKEKFDLIIIDSTDPIGPAVGLFQEEFYQLCFNALNDDGILAAQSESPFIPHMQEVIKDMNKNLKNVFPNVYTYIAFIPTYPSGLWAFSMASKKYNPLKDFQEEQFNKDNLELKYYNKDIHFAAFALPNFVKEILK